MKTMVTHLCLQSIAKHFNYSVSHISVFCDIRIHPINYVDNVRMQKTKQLLREADYPYRKIDTGWL